MYNASDLKKGLKIEIDGDPCMITHFEFSKPGKRARALYRCKIKNLISQNTFDKTFRSVDKVAKCSLMTKDFMFSYIDGENFIFSDNETYDEVALSNDILGKNKFFIIDDMQVQILFHNDRPIEVSLPNFVEVVIFETEPGARGDTATNVTKPDKIRKWL